MKERVEKLEIKIEEVGSEMKELRTILNKIEKTLEKFSNAIIEMTKNTMRLNKAEKDINSIWNIMRSDEEKITTNAKTLEESGKDRLKFGLRIALSAISASFAISMGAIGYVLLDVKDGLTNIKELHTAVTAIDKKVTVNEYKLDSMNRLIVKATSIKKGGR